MHNASSPKITPPSTVRNGRLSPMTFSIFPHFPTLFLRNITKKENMVEENFENFVSLTLPWLKGLEPYPSFSKFLDTAASLPTQRNFSREIKMQKIQFTRLSLFYSMQEHSWTKKLKHSLNHFHPHPQL